MSRRGNCPAASYSGILAEQTIGYFDYDLDLTASSVDMLEVIETISVALGKRARVHLKIDTGLERNGVHYYSAEELLTAALNIRHCDVVGIFSHFASADNQDLTFTRL